MNCGITHVFKACCDVSAFRTDSTDGYRAGHNLEVEKKESPRAAQESRRVNELRPEPENELLTRVEAVDNPLSPRNLRLLMTWYTFSFVGEAPKRLIVHASLRGQERVKVWN